MSSERVPTTAVDRAMQLMAVRRSELPPLAREFANHLCRQVGMCGETFITAYACYAQVIEGLTCDDDLYQIRQDHREWFEQRRRDVSEGGGG